MRVRPHSLTPIALAALLALGGVDAFAQPVPTQLPIPKPGGAIINAKVGTPTANSLTVTQTTSANNRALVEWTSFSIGSQARVDIVQPNAQSVLVNRVTGDGKSVISASEIYGGMSANGKVFLVNPAGVIFGAGAQVNVGSLVATSLDLADSMSANNYAGFIDGKEVLLTQSPNAASGVGLQVLPATDPNKPQIQVTEGGSIVLISPDQIVQRGTISAPKGLINMTTATATTLLPVGNSGYVELLATQPIAKGSSISAAFGSQTLAQGGQIVIGAQTQDKGARGDNIAIAGLVSADSATGKAGSVHIDAGASGSVSATEGAVITASSSVAGGTGGQITVLGENIRLQRGDIADPRVLAEGTAGGGRIVLGDTSTRALTIEQNTTVSADATESGNGGSIAVRALFNNPLATGPVARVDYGVTEVYGTLRSRGGLQSGNGGNIETSGLALTTRLTDAASGLTQTGTVDARARAAGGLAGTWVLDPFDVTISNSAPVGINGSFNPTGPGANVNAADLSAALDAGTSIDISTDAGGAGTAAGNITIATGTTISRSSGTAATSFTLRANNNILSNGLTFDASKAGPVNVTFLSDIDGNGTGNINLQGGRILTGGGDLTLSGGLNPATGYARGDAQNAAITVQGTGIDTRSNVGAGAGNVVMRGQAATGSAFIGVNLQSTMNVGNLSIEGLASQGAGVLLNGADITTAAGNIDMHGVATRTNSTTGTPTGVFVNGTRVQLGTGSLTLAGRGDDANLAGGGTATGLSIADLQVSAATNSTGRITLAGEAAGGSLGPGVVTSIVDFGLIISSNATALGSPATGASIVIGGASGAPTAALNLAGLNINTSSSVNLRPLGVSATGAITEQLTTPIFLASPATGATAAGFTVNTSSLITPVVGANGGIAAGQGFVIGSAGHTGAITVYDGVFNQHGNVALTLQNEGAGSQGITLGGGNAVLTLGLLTAGNVTQQGVGGINVQNLVIRGGAASNVNLNASTNQIGVLAFDQPNALTVLAQGNLTVNAASVQTFGAGGFAPLAITGSVGGNNARLTAPEVHINQPIAMAGTGAPVLDIVSTDAEFGVTFAPGATLTTGAAGRWRVWSDRVINAPTTGPTTNLYGCPYGSGSTCTVSLVPISPTGNQFLSTTQPTLTVTANPVTGFIGLPTPPLTYTVAGLINGDTATSALAGALGTASATSTTLTINRGTLSSPQGYLINFVPSTLTIAQANLDLLGVPRHMLQAGFRWEMSSDIYGRNLDQLSICTAASVISGSLADGGQSDPLASEWGKVRNQPQLSGCLNVTDGGSCSAF